MFDYLYSSYNLGEGFTNILCQTKDLERGIGGTMSNYWLSPAGQLYLMNYSGTHDLEIIGKEREEYRENMKFMNYRCVPNGTHGKVQPCNITDYVEVYPVKWEGDWEDWPRMRLHFKSGELFGYSRCN